MTTFEIAFAYLLLALGSFTLLALTAIGGTILWCWLSYKFF